MNEFKLSLFLSIFYKHSCNNIKIKRAAFSAPKAQHTASAMRNVHGIWSACLGSVVIMGSSPNTWLVFKFVILISKKKIDLLSSFLLTLIWREKCWVLNPKQCFCPCFDRRDTFSWHQILKKYFYISQFSLSPKHFPWLCCGLYVYQREAFSL